jgi:hypothetical protein
MRATALLNADAAPNKVRIDRGHHGRRRGCYAHAHSTRHQHRRRQNVGPVVDATAFDATIRAQSRRRRNQRRWRPAAIASSQTPHKGRAEADQDEQRGSIPAPAATAE